MYADGDFVNFGEKIFEVAYGPAQGHFLSLHAFHIFILDQDLNKPCTLFNYVLFNLILNNLLNLFLFYIKLQIP